MRDVVKGQAQGVEAWMLHHDPALREVLTRVLPGATWQTWETKHLRAMTEEVVPGVAEKVIEYLDGLAEGVEKVSSQNLKKALDLGDLPRMTWSRTTQHVSEHSGTWRLDKKSFVRVTASDYGLEVAPTP